MIYSIKTVRNVIENHVFMMWEIVLLCAVGFSLLHQGFCVVLLLISITQLYSFVPMISLLLLSQTIIIEGMMTWFDVTGGNGIATTNPDPSDRACVDVKIISACTARKEDRCNGSGRFIRFGRPGSMFCQQRCVQNYDNYIKRRIFPWACGKC
jgi:hypothetical protein